MKKWLIAGAGAAGLLISSVALARVDVGISSGIPGIVYPAPVYYRGGGRYYDRGYYYGRGRGHDHHHGRGRGHDRD
jgi:hypothetical protein